MIQNTDNFRTIATSGTQAQSGTIPSTTARIYSGLVGHYIAVGPTNPIANTGSFFLPAGMSMDISLPLNGKVSALAVSGTGIVTVAF